MKKKEKLRRLKELLEHIKETTNTDDYMYGCEHTHEAASKALEELFADHEKDQQELSDDVLDVVLAEKENRIIEQETFIHSDMDGVKVHLFKLKT